MEGVDRDTKRNMARERIQMWANSEEPNESYKNAEKEYRRDIQKWRAYACI